MRIRSLPVFLGLICLVALSGIQFEPGTWYAGLHKPPGTPPNWLFPVAWTLLYLLIAVAGWLAWQVPSGPLKYRAFAAYFLQLLLNAAWSWLFFGLHQPLAGLFDIILLQIAVAVNIYYFVRCHTVAGLLLIPYFLWVGYALYLNMAIVWLN